MQAALDLTSCDREPIRVPGSIQPHGVLFALDPETLEVLQASANAGNVLPDPAADPLGQRLNAALGPAAATLEAGLREAGATPRTLGALTLKGRAVHASAHRVAGLVLLELEEAAPGQDSLDELFPEIRAFIEALQAAPSFADLSALVVHQVREITGFDRVMAYRFDAAWNGTVVAEDRSGELPSYLDLRFPASDIPAQARELYRLNRLRLIPDAGYEAVPLRPPLDPRTGRPTDLGFAALRSVSPVHLEYMRNMGTGSSMSISVLRNGELWGLISCHSRGPHHVPPAARAACDLLGQIFALRIAAQEQLREAQDRVELQSVQSRLLAQMAAEENFVDGLLSDPDALLHLAGAGGAAVLLEDRCETVGQAPDPEDIRAIADWLARTGQKVVATDALPAAMPGAARFKACASGLLAISISQLHSGWVLWFRPEVVETVNWGGDPAKPATPAPDGLRLHPRRSFEIWKETVRDRSLPWRASEIDTASDLRNAIVGIVLRKAEELADLAQELTRSNKELEAFSYSVSHDLRAPFRHIVGFAELLREAGPEPLGSERLRYLDIITEAAHGAGRLVDDLLSYSQMGRAAILSVNVDMNRLVAEVRRLLAPDWQGRDIDWRIADLPPVLGDPVMLRQAWQNLLGNAIKYTRKTPEARIEVSAETRPNEIVYMARDNGVGFDMAYVGKLFGVFQRLHRVEEFEGTGIGLANVRRIAERHGGRVWAEGRKGEGATFFLALPRKPDGRD
jgi:light-regulated signal transduction histidine kinase (bacteriophytochrome)